MCWREIIVVFGGTIASQTLGYFDICAPIVLLTQPLTLKMTLTLVGSEKRRRTVTLGSIGFLRAELAVEAGWLFLKNGGIGRLRLLYYGITPTKQSKTLRFKNIGL